MSQLFLSGFAPPFLCERRRRSSNQKQKPKICSEQNFLITLDLPFPRLRVELSFKASLERWRLAGEIALWAFKSFIPGGVMESFHRDERVLIETGSWMKHEDLRGREDHGVWYMVNFWRKFWLDKLTWSRADLFCISWQYKRRMYSVAAYFKLKKNFYDEVSQRQLPVALKPPTIRV